jgi:folate-binding protein YgfZ
MVELHEAVPLVDDAAVAAPIERDLLVVTGADAATYLDGQLSQGIGGLAVGATARTLLLQPQGKIDAWLRVNRRGPETFWLDTDPGHGPHAEERLNRFKLRVDVAVEVATVSGLAVRGAASARVRADVESWIAASADPTGHVGLALLDAGWGGVAGFDVVGPDGVADPEALAGSIGVPLGPAELVELVRITQGLPVMGRELDGSTIPAAAGIVESSVDFAKGCYVGQELVARIDSRGSNTPTRLHRLRFADPAPPPVGSDLLVDGAVVGHVTSAVATPAGGAIGLGYLKRSVATPATLAVRVGSEAAPAVEAIPLPA